MKNRRVKVFAVIAACVFIIGALCSCGANDSKIKKLFGEFEKACKTADVEKMLDCCDPKIIGPARTVASFLGLTTEQINSYVYQVIDFGKLAASKIKMSDNLESALKAFETFEISPKKFEYNDTKDRCSVTCKVTYKYEGTKHTDEIVVKCIQRDEEWYFSIL